MISYGSATDSGPLGKNDVGSQNQGDQKGLSASGIFLRRSQASSLDKTQMDGVEYGLFIGEPHRHRRGADATIEVELNSAVRPQSKLVHTYKNP